MGRDGGRPRGYRFFRGPCTQCGKDVALSFTDRGYIWFRKHKPCGTFKTDRGKYEMAHKLL